MVWYVMLVLAAKLKKEAGREGMGRIMKKVFSSKYLVTIILVIVFTLIMIGSAFSETLAKEVISSIESNSRYYPELLLQIEIDNIISSDSSKIDEIGYKIKNSEGFYLYRPWEFDGEIIEPMSRLDGVYVVQNPSNIIVTVGENDGGLLTGYKFQKIEDDYVYNYDEEIEYSINNNVEKDFGDGYIQLVSQNGTAITLSEEGDYYITMNGGMTGLPNNISIFVTVVDGDNNVAENVVENETEDIPNPIELMAIPTSSKVLVNGDEISFDAYNIEGNNYFKLRDLAYVLSGTEKQFDVSWDGEIRAINLISNNSYIEVGGEMSVGNGESKTPILNTSAIFKDGVELKLSAYTINENNYFKLRDIGETFDIGVNWDDNTKTIMIDTTIGYVAE